MTNPRETKPFTDQDETWFTPPIVVPLVLLLAVVLRALFLAQH